MCAIIFYIGGHGSVYVSVEIFSSVLEISSESIFHNQFRKAAIISTFIQY